MCRQFRVRFAECGPTLPASARAFASTSLRAELGRGPNAAIDSVVLIVSELVTNSVRAACTIVELVLDVQPALIRVIVQDDAAGDPVAQSVGSRSTHGRGLAIVAAVSREWGVEPGEGGKRVWAEVALAPIAHTSSCAVSP